MYRDQIVRNTSKIITRQIILAFSVCRDHNIMDLLQKEHHEILAETGIRQMTCYILNIDSHNPFTSAFKHKLFCLVKFVWLANIKPKRIASASRGFLAAERLSCITPFGCDSMQLSVRGVLPQVGVLGGVKISLIRSFQRRRGPKLV